MAKIKIIRGAEKGKTVDVSPERANYYTRIGFGVEEKVPPSKKEPSAAIEKPVKGKRKKTK